MLVYYVAGHATHFVGLSCIDPTDSLKVSDACFHTSVNYGIIYLKGEWENVVADLGFHRGVRRVTVYLILVSEDNEENVSINWPPRYKYLFHAQLR